MLYFVVDYFRLNKWYKKKKKKNFLSLSFQYNSMTIVHKVNRYIFSFYLVNIKKRKKKSLEKLLTKSNSFDRIHTLLSNNSHTYTYIHLYILVGFKKRWWWWRWCYYQHRKSFNMLVMMTTTRLCALFICLLRPCRNALAYAGSNNSKKKNHYDHHLILSFYTQRDYYLIILNS